MGADLAYIGSAFIATQEARAGEGYKQMITASTAEDIVYSNLFTGVHGNYLKPSIVAAGIYGTVVSFSDTKDEVVVKVDDGTRLRMTKNSILRNLTREEEAVKAQKDTKEGAP